MSDSAEAPLGLFRQRWWLDAAAGAHGWGEVRVVDGGATVALLRYSQRRKWGVTTLAMPPLTQTLGPWFAPMPGKSVQTLAREKDLVECLVAQLPPHAYFAQNFAPELGNWLPWHWLGFSQTTRYTYTLPLAQGEKALWERLLPKARTDIRKAGGRFRLTVRSDLGIDAFLQVQRLTFARQGLEVPVADAVTRRIDAACAERGCRRIFFAVDGDGAVHAAVYLVWDSQRAYYLMGGGDPALRHSGATSLAMWEAIRFAAGIVPTFDFEGSMLEPVERFIRGFGAVQQPYSRVWRAHGRLAGVALALRDAARAMTPRRRS